MLNPPVRVTTLAPNGTVTMEFSKAGLLALGNVLNAYDCDDLLEAGLSGTMVTDARRLWDAASICLDLTQPGWESA